MRGLFEENPLMKNCGITLERGRNYTWGRQIFVNFQVLDKLRVERERGITVKAQTASIIYKDESSNIEYLLNLIDTPVSIYT